MRVYFLADRQCGLYANGAYLGIADGFERFAEAGPSDGILFEYRPCGEFLPLCFRLTEDFLLSPPPQVDLYYTEKGVAVYAHDFLRADQSLRVLFQKRLAGSLVTLTVQGKLLLDLENETGFHLVELPEALLSCDAESVPGGILLVAEGAFALLSRKGEMLLFSEGRMLSRGETIRAEVSFHDSLCHTAVCEWRGAELLSCKISARAEPTEATYALALFESVLIGGDVLPYLDPSLHARAGELKEYLGDFRSVVLTEERDKVGLVYRRRERVYDVRYFRVEQKDGKVSNIKPA